MDWSQVSLGAVIGGVGTWLASVTRSFLDAWIQERAKDKDEERKIKTEERAALYNEHKQQRDAEKDLAHHNHRLLLIKTRIRGATTLLDAAQELRGLHEFFDNHPRYISIPLNRNFLEMWPNTLFAEVAAGRHRAVTTGQESRLLAGLKMEVERLTLS